MPDIPEDHPIRKVWRANRMRSLQDRIQLANEGDTQAARQLLGLFVYQVRTPRINIAPELLEYVAERFEKILALRSDPKLAQKAGAALGITTGKHGGQRLTAKEEQYLADVGYQVAQKIDINFAECGKKLKNKAAAEVAKKCGVSQPTALKAYEKYMVVEK